MPRVNWESLTVVRIACLAMESWRWFKRKLLAKIISRSYDIELGKMELSERKTDERFYTRFDGG